MSTEAISGSSLWAGTNGVSTKVPQSQPEADNASLDQDAFFKILVAQLTTQDPFKPMENMEFFSQMAQFSNLEQARGFNAELLERTDGMQAELASLRGTQQVLQASSLLGREVLLQVDGQSVVRGSVASVDVEAGTPWLVVNGSRYRIDDVLSVGTEKPTVLEDTSTK